MRIELTHQILLAGADVAKASGPDDDIVVKSNFGELGKAEKSAI